MKLTVRQKGKKINEYNFAVGPIYIGRQMGSQVFLPDRSVSRQHAVIYTAKNGAWVAEDLDSANKTYLNKHAIHRSAIKDGDTLNVGEFNIKIQITDDESENDSHKTAIHLDDTIAEINPDIHADIRVANSKSAPMIKIPALRTKDILKASCALSKVRSMKSLHRQLLDIVLSQFAPLNAWVALRKDDDGPMDLEGGRKISSETVKLADLMMAERINEATDKKHYIIVPQLPRGKVRSVIIAPILSGRKCHGVLYANNSSMHEAYTMADLDYLMLLSIHAAAIMELI
ncbi:MAG: FHA domain-containing protein [Planctomycetes bacterium]|nr:FHA domain-containing protein [Planctomycetota bacterium]